MTDNFIKIFGFILIGVLLVCCKEKQPDRPEFVPTKFINDTTDLKLRQVIRLAPDDRFVAIYYKDSPMSFGSGNKIMKLYTKDSVSIDECFYGAHPLGITDWNDSTLIIKCAVSSGHGDKKYRKWYLDISVDKNDKIGDLNIIYMKNY